MSLPGLRRTLGPFFERALGRALKAVLLPISELECGLSRRWVSGAHRRLKVIQWGLPPSPKNMDHHIDLFSEWLRKRDAVWLERGVFNSLALSGGTVLELTCGDGFNTRNFYSLKSRHITACDIDVRIIATARRKNSAPNVTYLVGDIVTGFPAGTYGNVIWDFGYPITEFFTPDQLAKVFTNIKAALDADGIFSGYTVAEDAENNFTPSGPSNRLVDKRQLQDLLLPYFKVVRVFQTLSPGRRNFYFWASDAVVPFQAEWANALSARNAATDTAVYTSSSKPA